MRKLRILVVDDDKDNADSLGELFQLEGHDVRVVYSGEAAIHAYLKADFDFGFIDVMMPGMNGVESFMEIRKLKPKANVFMMSGYSVEELLRQAMSHGARGMFSKPVDPQTLLSTVHDIGENGVLVAQGRAPISLTSSNGWPLKVTHAAASSILRQHWNVAERMATCWCST
jgi:two-component system, NtrC family, response regulator HydG